jgi:putative aldouronate transport system substrate-binding protein
MKQKTFSRAAAWVVAVMMLVTLLAGCGGKPAAGSESTATEAATTTVQEETKPNPDEPGWKQDTKPVTLDWYINYDWFTSTWGPDVTALYVTEKTGVTVNFSAPTGNAADKMNTMIASDSLPDLVTLDTWDENVRKITEGGFAYSVNELADQFDPYFYKAASKAVLAWFAHKDGKTYGYPNFCSDPTKVDFSKAESNQAFLVRKDIYEQIGKPEMRTPDGFLNALKAAKEKFPTIDGQKLIPFASTMFSETGCWGVDGLLQNFLAVPWEKDGKLYDKRLDPEYVTWLKTLRKAHEMGLISKDIFVDKQKQMDEKAARGQYFAILGLHSSLTASQQALYKKDPNTVYIAIDGPANSKGDAPILGGGPTMGGWGITMISKKNKNPERSIKFMSYLISEEGQHDMEFGKQGVMWDTIDGKDQVLPEVKTMLDTDRAAYDKKFGGEYKYWMLHDPVVAKQWDAEKVEPLKQPHDWTIGKVIDVTAYSNLEPPADSEEGIIKKKTDTEWGLILPKLLLAKSDAEFEKLWNKFHAEKDSLGYAKLLEYMQKSSDDKKTKLGIK